MDLGFLKHLLTTTCLDQSGDLPPLPALSNKLQKFERNTQIRIYADIDPAFDSSKPLSFEMVVDDDHLVEEKGDEDVEDESDDDDSGDDTDEAEQRW